MFEGGIARHRVELGARHLECHGSLELAPDNAAKTAANGGQAGAFGRLHDQPDAIALHMPESARKSRGPLAERLRGKADQHARDGGNENEVRR